MADSYVQVPPNSTGSKLATSELTDGGNTVERQQVVIADPATAANVAGVTAGGALKTDGSATTQPISAASLPLPVGASTAAKQAALGVAGTPSADVLSVQGVASMTALKTDGSGVTQPVSGTVTANAGTNMSTAGLAQETGGNLATIATNSGKLPALGQATKAASVPVTLASDQGAIPVSQASLPALAAGEAHIGALGGATVAVSGSVTRPANTTAYAAGQVVGTASTDVITIANAARKVGGSGVLLDLLLIDQGGAAAAGSFEVYLFTAAPTAQADQVAFALVAADLSNLIAVVPVAGSYVTNVAATISGSRVYPITGVNAGFVCAGGSTSLYAVIVTRAAYTPISAEAFTVIAQISQD